MPHLELKMAILKSLSIYKDVNVEKKLILAKKAELQNSPSNRVFRL